MTDFEFLSAIISLIAVAIAFLSLYRTRKNSEIHIELEKIHAKLSEKQLERILEDEDREGQPVFAIRVVRISGTGDTGTPNYTVKIKVQVDNTGEGYLEGKHIYLTTIKDGTFANCSGAYFDHLDPREHDPILGERDIVIKPDSKIAESKLHIIYIDNLGNSRIQQYAVFPEGPKGPLPYTIHFNYEKSYQIAPSILWTI